MKMRNERGFSLIELMVTVAIIGILATVAVPNYDEFVLKARIRGTESHLAGIKVVVETYHASLGFYPEIRTLNVAGLSRNDWAGRTGTPFAPTAGCAGIHDTVHPENGEAIRAICEEFEKRPQGSVHQNCGGETEFSYIYTGHAQGGYKIIAYCMKGAELSRLPDPYRDGGADLGKVDGNSVYAFGFWAGDATAW